MVFRAIQRKLRDIERHSRRVERSWADRVQSTAFVLALLVAPLITWRMETWSVSRKTVLIASVSVFKSLEGKSPERESLDGVRVRDPSDPLRFPASTMPMAEVDFLRDRTRHGWPFSTRETLEPARAEATLLPACPDSRRAEVIAVAREVVARGTPELLGPDARIRETHLPAFFFSAGVWWMLLTLVVWLVLLPIRTLVIVRRALRNAIRQGRIDRCLCPNCGYDAHGSLMTGRCPECGSELYERPHW